MKNTDLSNVEKEIYKRVAKNINLLLEVNDINYSYLQRKLKESEEVTISSSYLNKILNHPENFKLTIPILMQICDFFGVKVDTILSSSLTVEECVIEKDSNFKKLIDTKALIESHNKQHLENEETVNEIENIESVSSADSLFIEDPNNNLFSSFLQTYYCYFFPTVSSENKEIDSLLTGTLELFPDNGKCKAILKIDTKKKNDEGTLYKIYEGTAVISSSVDNLHCILRSEEIGEYCYIIFQHYHLNFVYQDCHMAEVLSTSSAGSDRKRYPTVLRMFLSRQEIKKEHWRLLAPHLWLNYSQITISEKGLEALKEMSDEYYKVVDDLLNKTEPEKMYLFKEKDVTAFAKEYMNKEDVIKFLTEMRLQSYAYRYNKVSKTVEDSVRYFLMSLGYYSDHKNDE